jgi:tetratricopeptide (TPR) repeat protein
MQNRNLNGMGDVKVSAIPAPAAASVATSGFSKFIKWCLAGLVFAVPLFILPFTSEVREFNKQTLIFLVVVVMLALWVIRILTTRAVGWVKTSLDFILLVYVLVYLASSLFSIDKVSSFLGYYGRFTGSFLSVLSLVVLYYIIVNHIRTRRAAGKLATVMLASGGLVILYSLLQIFGVYVLPFSFAKTTAFNPVGSLVSLGIFTAAMIVMAQWAWLALPSSKLKQVLYGAVTVLGLAVLFLVNAFVAWIILALSMIIFLALAMVLTSNREPSGYWIWKPLLVLVISILFVGFSFLPQTINPRGWLGTSVRLPAEIQLSNSATWQMVKNSVTAKPLLGFGPGTTGIAFGQIKPETLNQSFVWSLNFDRASSEIASLAIETGLLGLLAFEAAAVLFLFYGLFFLLRQTDHPGRMHAFGLFTVWLTLYVAHFFYFYNTTLYFLFWVTLAMFMAITHWSDAQNESRSASMAESPRQALSWMFASLLILAVLLVGAFFQVAVYFADSAYASGIKELNKKDPDLSRSNQLFSSAIQRNPYRDVYYLAFAQNLVFRAAQEARKDEPNIAQFQSWIRDMIGAANSATSYSPNKASNWAARGQFYSQIRALSVPGTDDLIIASAEEAVKKDDRNPVLQLQLAQAYANAAETIDPSVVAGGTDTDADGLSDQNEQALGSNSTNSDTNSNGVSDGDEVRAGFNPAGTGRVDAPQLQKFTKIDQDKLRKGEEAVKKAISLKADLPDAYVSLGRIYEKWNKLEDARKILNDGVKLMPNNADIKYELGRVMFNLKDYSGAESIFNEVVKLVPDHANAHYSLGLVALQKNDRAKALSEFKKTREITGSNAQLDEVIKQLEANPK